MPALLPRAVQRDGQRRYLLMAVANPLGATLTIGQVSVLLALHYGASDLAMGLIYGAVYLAGLGAVLAPLLLTGRDTTAITAWSWWARSLLGGLVLLLPLMADPAVKVWVLVGIIYGFFTLRGLAMATMPSVMRALCTDRELPRLNAGGHMRWHLGTLATSVLAFLVLRHQAWFPSLEAAFISLMAVGFVFNLVASWVLSTLPPTGTLERGSLASLRTAVHLVWRERRFRDVVVLTLLMVPMAIAAAYQINYLDKVLLLGGDVIFALTLGGTLAAIAVTRALAVIGPRIQGRVLLLGSHLGLVVLGLAWTCLKLVPDTAQFWTAGGLYMASLALLAASGALLAHLANERLPEQDQVQVSVIYQLSGVVAGLLGIALVQLVALPGDWSVLPGMHRYSHAFAVWTVLSMAICVVGWTVVTGRGAGIAADLAQLLPANLATVFRAHRLEVRGDPGPGRVRAIEDVLQLRTPASRALLMECLAAPQVRSRLAALRSLPEWPVAEALPLVIAEARDLDSPLRLEAVTALGFLREASSIAALRGLMDDHEPLVRAAIWKSLLRHGEDLGRVALLSEYRAAPSARARLELLIGLSAARRADVLLGVMAYDLAREASLGWIATVLQHLGEAQDDGERMVELLAIAKDDPGRALDDLLTEQGDPLAGLSHVEWRRVLVDKDWTSATAHLPEGLRPRDGMTLVGLLAAVR